MNKYFHLLFFVFLFEVSFTNLSAQQLQWAKTIDAQWGSYARSIAVDKEGNVYAAGSHQGVTNFDPNTNNPNVVYNDTADFYITKTSSNGTLIWAKTVGSGASSDEISSIAVDDSGNVYASGRVGYNVDFDPGPGIHMQVLESIYVLKLNANGDFVWVQGFDYVPYVFPDEQPPEIYCLKLDSQGNAYITGEFESDIYYYDVNSSLVQISTNGDKDAFICKITNSGQIEWLKAIGGANKDIGTAVTVTRDDTLYFVGQYQGTVDFDLGAGQYNLTGVTAPNYSEFLLKMTSDGNFVSAIKILSNYGHVAVLATDSLGYIYAGGNFSYTVDFDPDPTVTNNLTATNFGDAFILKLSPDGNYKWVRRFGGPDIDDVRDIKIDKDNNINICGHFNGTGDYNPNTGVVNLQTNGSYDVFFAKVNTNGTYITAKSFGGPNGEALGAMAIDDDLNIYFTAHYLGESDLDASLFHANIYSATEGEIFIVKYNQKGVTGTFYNDTDSNCVRAEFEPGLNEITGIIEPGGIVVQSKFNGIWHLDSLAPGNYTITYSVPDGWIPSCALIQNFTVSNSDVLTMVPAIGLKNLHPCSQPEVTIMSPRFRRCFSNQKIYVSASNDINASGAINSAYVDVKLDTFIAVTGASRPYSALPDHTFRFQLNTLNPGQRIDFTIDFSVNCYAPIGQNVCMEAFLFPVDSCVFDTIAAPPLFPGPGTTAPCTLPWDHSSLSVDSWCANDTVYFTVTNNGSSLNGNMLCYTPVRVYVDGVLFHTDSIMLAGQQIMTYSYPGNGQTWILQADQHPMHPGNSHPNAHIEACGDSTNWTPNLVNVLPLDDADPVVDMYCGFISTSFDPNDKTGFPMGLGADHEILPNQQLQYLIRFQNTGNDTAFTVVIRDTLDTDLNIFSVASGVSSHPYSFRMYGPRVLEWTFTQILLPDSNTNESASHGFVTFTVEQNPNLSNGTTILNDVGIYFDFNAPVITNTTLHTINDQLHNFAVGVNENKSTNENVLKIYPNPANTNVTIIMTRSGIGSIFTITNQLGQLVQKGTLNAEQNTLDINNLSNGFYVITVEGKLGKQSTKLIKQ